MRKYIPTHVRQVVQDSLNLAAILEDAADNVSTLDTLRRTAAAASAPTPIVRAGATESGKASSSGGGAISGPSVAGVTAAITAASGTFVSRVDAADGLDPACIEVSNEITSGDNDGNVMLLSIFEPEPPSFTTR